MKIEVKNKYIFWLLSCIEFLIFDIFSLFILNKLFNIFFNMNSNIVLFIYFSSFIFIIYLGINLLFSRNIPKFIKFDNKEIDINGLDTYVATWQEELRIYISYTYDMKVLSKKYNIINYKL